MRDSNDAARQRACSIRARIKVLLLLIPVVAFHGCDALPDETTAPESDIVTDLAAHPPIDTGEGPISYWNNYVAVTQMGGHGSFSDPRLGVDIRVPPQEDLVTSKLPALRQYQFSLRKPPPPPGSFNAQAAARGEVVFKTVAKCSRCHAGPLYTDHGNLHDPSETGMDPTHAQRGATKKYRTTPLRALWQHAPYFHDGSAPTLAAVVDHYNSVLGLGLTQAQKLDLIEYLKSI
jgi:hypothetical protein